MQIGLFVSGGRWALTHKTPWPSLVLSIGGIGAAALWPAYAAAFAAVAAVGAIRLGWDFHIGSLAVAAMELDASVDRHRLEYRHAACACDVVWRKSDRGVVDVGDHYWHLGCDPENGQFVSMGLATHGAGTVWGCTVCKKQILMPHSTGEMKPATAWFGAALKSWNPLKREGRPSLDSEFYVPS